MHKLVNKQNFDNIKMHGTNVKISDCNVREVLKHTFLFLESFSIVTGCVVGHGRSSMPSLSLTYLEHMR
jgi:hypothetical protein